MATYMSYIEDAFNTYNNLLTFDFSIYKNLVYGCLTEHFRIKSKEDILILKATTHKLYSAYVSWSDECYTKTNIKEITELIKSEDNKSDNSATYYLDLKQVLKDDKIKEDQTYSNHLNWLFVAKEIVGRRDGTIRCANLTKDEWFREMQKDGFPDGCLNKLTSACITYTYMKDVNLAAQQLMDLPFRLYNLFLESVLHAEFLYVDKYSEIFKYLDIPAENKYCIYPSIVKIGINSLCEEIQTCYNHFLQIVNIKEDNPIQENISVTQSLNVYDSENPNYIDLAYWDQIINIIQLSYRVALIDLSYISNDKNVATLCDHIHHLTQLNKYIKDKEDILCELNNELYARIYQLNTRALFKSEILLKQILEQKQPIDSVVKIPHFQYNIMGYSAVIEKLLKKDAPIIEYVNHNVFIKYCKDHNRKSVNNSNLLFKSIDKNNEIGIDQTNIYNLCVVKGIDANLEYSSIYGYIKDNDHEQLLEILEKKMGLLHPHSTPPSMYVKVIMRLSELAHNAINRNSQTEEENLNKILTLLNAMMNKLRMFILSYKNQLTAPYRFRPPLEYSYYRLDDGGVTLCKFNDISSIKIEEEIFFISSWGFNPINYRFLENFYYLYNRDTHDLNRQKRELDVTREAEKLDEVIKINEEIKEAQKTMKANLDKVDQINENIVEKLEKEQKSTIQMLGVFGSFIALVSSIAGMVKSVQSFWQFVLFCITFMGCIVIFIWCLYYFFTKKEDRKDAPIILLFILLVVIISIGHALYSSAIL